MKKKKMFREGNYIPLLLYLERGEAGRKEIRMNIIEKIWKPICNR